MKQTILLDLDVLLDTRLATLLLMDRQVMSYFEKPEMYWHRTSDNFEQLTKGKILNADFEARYAARDVTTLQNSVLTNMVFPLGDLTRRLQGERGTGLDIEEIRVIINCWPYKLSQEERDALADAVLPYLAISTQCSVVSISPKDLTPMKLNSISDMWITYDFDGWDKVQRPVLLANGIRDYTIMMPKKFLTGKEPTRADLTDEFGTIDPWKALIMLMLEWVQLEVQPLMMYSRLNHSLLDATPTKSS